MAKVAPTQQEVLHGVQALPSPRVENALLRGATAHTSVTHSDIPARLDRLPWSRWHWRVVLALGAAWVLDGLEVTIVGSLGAVLERPDTLGLDASQVGWAGSVSYTHLTLPTN